MIYFTTSTKEYICITQYYICLWVLHINVFEVVWPSNKLTMVWHLPYFTLLLKPLEIFLYPSDCKGKHEQDRERVNMWIPRRNFDHRHQYSHLVSPTFFYWSYQGHLFHYELHNIRILIASSQKMVIRILTISCVKPFIKGNPWLNHWMRSRFRSLVFGHRTRICLILKMLQYHYNVGTFENPY